MGKPILTAVCNRCVSLLLDRRVVATGMLMDIGGRRRSSRTVTRTQLHANHTHNIGKRRGLRQKVAYDSATFPEMELIHAQPLLFCRLAGTTLTFS